MNEVSYNIDIKDINHYKRIMLDYIKMFLMFVIILVNILKRKPFNTLSSETKIFINVVNCRMD